MEHAFASVAEVKKRNIESGPRLIEYVNISKLSTTEADLQSEMVGAVFQGWKRFYF